MDVTLTGDTPKSQPMEVSLGKGPAVKVKDGGMLADPRVVEWMCSTAEKKRIPYQREVLEGGSTDATRHPDDARGRAGGLSLHPLPLRAYPVRDGGLRGCAEFRQAPAGPVECAGELVNEINNDHKVADDEADRSSDHLFLPSPCVQCMSVVTER